MVAPKGGKAQSRLEDRASGDGGRDVTGVVLLRGALPKGDR